MDHFRAKEDRIQNCAKRLVQTDDVRDRRTRDSLSRIDALMLRADHAR
jgi:hypothetical protein